MNYATLSVLQDLAKDPPRVHGNGFIQIDLIDGKRVNVWGHPAIPRQVVSSQIHNHRFSFTSRILIGSLVNVWWSENDLGNIMDIYEPVRRKGEDTRLVKISTGTFLPYRVNHLMAGESYDMRHGAYHETFVNSPTMTLMTKTFETGEIPRVLLGTDKQPDNDFVRHEAADQDFLWNIVRETIESA